MNLEIYNETSSRIPEKEILKIKEEILGPLFELQISILKGVNSKKINWKQRKEKYIPNTLSFKYSENSGEIILTPEIIQAETYELCKLKIKENSKKIIYLTIHSMLHLKNFDHGEEMEKLEEICFRKFV